MNLQNLLIEDQSGSLGVIIHRMRNTLVGVGVEVIGEGMTLGHKEEGQQIWIECGIQVQVVQRMK